MQCNESVALTDPVRSPEDRVHVVLFELAQEGSLEEPLLLRSVSAQHACYAAAVYPTDGVIDQVDGPPYPYPCPSSP